MIAESLEDRSDRAEVEDQGAEVHRRFQEGAEQEVILRCQEEAEPAQGMAVMTARDLPTAIEPDRPGVMLQATEVDPEVRAQDPMTVEEAIDRETAEELIQEAAGEPTPEAADDLMIADLTAVHPEIAGDQIIAEDRMTAMSLISTVIQTKAEEALRGHVELQVITDEDRRRKGRIGGSDPLERAGQVMRHKLQHFHFIPIRATVAERRGNLHDKCF